MAKKSNKKELTLKQKHLIIKIAGAATLGLFIFSLWFGVIRTGLISL